MTGAHASDDDDRPVGDDGEPFHVIVVCTANIARSPLAMAMLEDAVDRRLGPAAPVWVDSAGVHAREGDRAASSSVAEAANRGLELGAHRSRPLDRDDVREADLVLVMTADHRATVARMAPGATHKTFTIPELARLADHVEGRPDGAPVDRARAAVRAAAAARLTAPPSRRHEDVVDPIRQPRAAYRLLGQRFERELDTIADLLFGPAGRS